MPERMIFCLTTGRSGTAYLTKWFGLLVSGILSEHEPQPDFASTNRAALTKPGAAATFWTERKLPHIDSLPCAIYAMMDHGFKYYAAALLKVGRAADVIVLRRPAREVALSYWRRGHFPGRTEVGLRYFPKPDDPLTVLPLEGWQQWTDYQLCYWYCQETAVRVEQLARRYLRAGAVVVETSLAEVTTIPGLERVMDRLELKWDWSAITDDPAKRVNFLRPNLYCPPPSDLDEQEAEINAACESVLHGQ